MPDMLFSYGPRFWVSLTMAICMFLFTKERKKHFVFSFPACLLVSFFAFYQIYQGPDTLLHSIPSYVFSIGLMILMGIICFEICWNDCVFCVLAGYGVQHIVSLTIGCVPDGLSAILFPGTLPGLCRQLLFRLLLYAGFYALFGSRLKKGDHVSLGKGPLLLVFALGVFAEIVFYDIIRRSYAGHPRDLVYYAQNLTSMLCSFALLLLQFTMLLQHSLENELHVLAQMRQM